MGRVNRLMERRALRRAADQALLTSLGGPASSQPGGAPDRDFRYADSAVELLPPSVQAAPEYEPVAPEYEPEYEAEYEPEYDHDPDTSPIPVFQVEESVLPKSVPPWEDPTPIHEPSSAAAEPADIYDLVDEQPSHVARAGDEVVAAAAPIVDVADIADIANIADIAPAQPRPPLRARPLAETAYGRPELDFALSNYREPWLRAKPVLAAVVASVVAALAFGGWLVFRSPDTAVEQSSTDAATSAPPAPSTVPPAAVSAAKPPPAAPPPPPPPPPPEPTYSAPQRQYQPRYTEPSPAQKPRVDVTRAPMSVAPVPKPVPGSNSSTPGDAPGEKPRRRGCFGFC